MKKIVLAYSGGLDTSVILKWLQNKYKCVAMSKQQNVVAPNQHTEVFAKTFKTTK